MFNLNQKGVFHLLVPIILLIGIIAGVYLVQRTQIFNPKAAPTIPTAPEASFELELEKNAGISSAGNVFTDDPTPPYLTNGSMFRVDVYARSDTDVANLFSAKVKYTSDTADFVSIEKRDGQSFVKNWVEASVDNSNIYVGVVSLVGGLPNPGIQTDPKTGALLMGSVIFKAKKTGTLKVELSDSSAIYSNVSNINILSARKGLIEVPIQESPPPSPSPTPPALSCNNVTVEGGILSKFPTGDTYYLVDSEAKVKLTASGVTPQDAKLEWKQVSKSIHLSGGQLEPDATTHMANYTVPQNSRPDPQGVYVRADFVGSSPVKSCPTVHFVVKPAPQLSPSPSPTSGTTFTLSPASGSLTPNGSGSVTVTIQTKTTNGGYTDYRGKVSGSLTDMQLNKKYDIWFASPRGYTPVGASTIITDSAGKVTFSDISFSVRDDNSASHNIISIAYAFDANNPAPDGCSQYKPCLSAAFSFPTTPAPTTSPQSSRVFVTGITYSGANFGGLSGADAKCQERANAFNLGGTWKAWLSSSDTNAKDRVPDTQYRRIDNEIVANNKADLLDGTLITPINRAENNSEVPGSEGFGTLVEVYTATSQDGTRSSTGGTCNDWNSSNDNLTVTVGGFSFTDSKWTNKRLHTCSYSRRLYCFEQTSAVPPAPSPSPQPGNGDGNSDGKVDLIDLSILLSDINKTSGFRVNIDMNGDGKINTFDFALMRNLLIEKKVIKDSSPKPEAGCTSTLDKFNPTDVCSGLNVTPVKYAKASFTCKSGYSSIVGTARPLSICDYEQELRDKARIVCETSSTQHCQ